MAVTIIPWGDGSGDNIYLTFQSASGDQTVQVSSDAYAGSTDRTKTITFTASHHGTTETKMLTVVQEGVPEDYIVFADPNLEAFCANQWGDGIGLKPSQAAAVTGTMTRGLFDGNYTSFDEFRYFGFTAMETYSFRSTPIKSIIIPSGITVISNWSFYQSQLESVILPDTLTTIQMHAFRYAKLKSVTIPASVTFIGTTAFYNNGYQFTTAILLPTVPPTIENNTFMANNKLKIYVPYSSDGSILNAYKASWTALTSKIYELNPDGTIPT